MKKFLIATTALTLAAGAAAAQDVSTNSGTLSITGQAWLGVQHTKVGGAPSTTNLDNRFQLNFQVTKETDAGVTFGAFSRVRIQDTAGVLNTGTFSGGRVWAQAGGLRFTLGNQDGAIIGAGVSHGYAGGYVVGYEGGQQGGDAAGLVTRTGRHAFTSIGGGQMLARLDYTFGGTSFALSHDDTVGGKTEAGVRHRFGDFTVAAGVARGGAGPNVATVSGSWNAGDYRINALVARIGSVTAGNVSASASFGASSVYGYVGKAANAGGTATSRAYGAHYAYDLGGASLVVGAEKVGNTTTASAGAVFTF